MEKRKHYYIDKGFQTKFIIKFCAINIAASLAIGVLIYVLNRNTNTVAFENLKVVVKSTSDFILPILLQVLPLVTLLVSFATIVIALYASHKISGPLFRMNVEIEKMKQRDFTHPIRIRATDQLQAAAQALEELRENQRSVLKEIREGLTRLRETKEPNSRRNAEELIEQIHSKIAGYRL